MSFVRRVCIGPSPLFCGFFVGIILSYHPKVSMIIIQKQGRQSRQPVVYRWETTSTV
jgi:hypothetical protein